MGYRVSNYVGVFDVPDFSIDDPPDACVSKYQLMKQLEASGFSHQLVDKEGMKLAKEAPYQHGSAANGQPLSNKVWYTRTQGLDASRVNRWYFQALLSAPKHGQPVPHFASPSEYRALVDPDFVPTRKRKHLQLLFNAEEALQSDWPEDAILQVKPKKPRRAPRRCAAIADAPGDDAILLERAEIEDAPSADAISGGAVVDSGQQSSEAEGRQNQKVDDASQAPLPDAPNSAASPSSSSSSSSSSTSSSSNKESASGSAGEGESSSSSSSSSSSGSSVNRDAQGDNAGRGREPVEDDVPPRRPVGIRRTAERVVE